MAVVERARATVRASQVVALEQSGGLAAGVVVELVDQQDVGPYALDDLGDRVGLVVARLGEVGYEPSLSVAVQGCVERGEADSPFLAVVGRRVRSAGQRDRDERDECNEHLACGHGNFLREIDHR